MPLGKILKLLTEAFNHTPPESANASELPPTEEIPLPTTAENPQTPLPPPIVTEDFQLAIAALNTETPSLTPSPKPSPTILEKKIMINMSMLEDELQNFVSGTSDIQGAALVSPDGLALASVLPGGMDEERNCSNVCFYAFTRRTHLPRTC